MESPRIHGDAEEKSSCESGWTMYIQDTFHENHYSDVVYEDYDDDVKEVDDDGGDDDDGESSDNESNDSMTSDASSGPSTQLSRNTKKHAAAKNSNTKKQVNHQTKSRAREKFSQEEEESEVKARTRTTAASRVQSRGKVSKTK